MENASNLVAHYYWLKFTERDKNLSLKFYIIWLTYDFVISNKFKLKIENVLERVCS